MAEIKQAIYLINQGKKREAQSILKEIIRSNPQEITAWFWYVETLDSFEKRIQLLETCLKQNPGNPQTTKALEMLRAKQSSKHLVAAASTNSENLSPFSEYKETSKSKSVLYDEEPPKNTTYYADEENKNKENYIPNILIPENEKVIARLKSFNVFHAMILPLSSGKINNDRLHPDFWDEFISKASDLPPDSKYVVYGFPALIHPETGVIFGYAVSMSNTYRLPETIAQELQAYWEKELSRVRRKKMNKNSGDEPGVSYSPPPLESNWVDSLSFTKNLLRKCYDYYGREQYKSRIVHLNVDEDLKKPPPPPPFYEAWLDRVFFLLILVVGFLIVLFINYAMDNFKISDVIDLFKNR